MSGGNFNPMHSFYLGPTVQLPAPPPPPPPQDTQFNYGAHQAPNQNFYSPQQYHQRQYGNNPSVGGRYGNGPLPYPRPDNQQFNRQLMSDQQAVRGHLKTGDLLKEREKLLNEKDAQIQELLAKVANLEIVPQENVQLREKLQELGDIEAKKQELELQEFSLNIKRLEGTEADYLKEQLGKSEKFREDAEEMVNVLEVCYYRNIKNILKRNEDKLEAPCASDQTFWMRQLNHMKNQYKVENEKLQNKLKETKLEAKNPAELASYWEKKYNELKIAWYVRLIVKFIEVLFEVFFN
ncbi:hypothetical protein CAEBREN_21244 [Caenorhabditis brenneri]|uniref:Uncharacterized protein n=1 Tax=Caenorhabditis brenneri TaxID=135651 RepID=G0P452_CAEBE|nr:hypothetical protein CAEBREN_21244 [Caenorhabditis brenneri]